MSAALLTSKSTSTQCVIDAGAAAPRALLWLARAGCRCRCAELFRAARANLPGFITPGESSETDFDASLGPRGLPGRLDGPPQPLATAPLDPP